MLPKGKVLNNGGILEVVPEENYALEWEFASNCGGLKSEGDKCFNFCNLSRFFHNYVCVCETEFSDVMPL